MAISDLLDRLDAQKRLQALTGVPVERMVTVVHEGEPLPKERPRFTGRRAYTSSRTESAEKALAWSIKAALAGRRFTANVAILSVFYRSTRHRADLDNCAKLLLDSANMAGIWVDDSQVTLQLARLEYDKQRPRTVAVFCEHECSLDRSMEAR